VEGSVTRERRTLAWQELLVAVAGLLAVLLLCIGVALSDREAIAFGVITLAGIALLRVRNGVFGHLLLGLLFVDTAVWLVPAAVDNIANHDRFSSVALPVVVSSIALVGLAAIAGRRLEQRRATAGAPTLGPLGTVAGGSGLLLVTLLVAAVVGVGRGGTVPAGAGALSARNTAFTPEVLHVKARVETPTGTTVPSATEPPPNVPGEVTVALTNHDLFWHTFTVDRLGVSLKVPVGGRRQVTFTARPGTYTFYCAIPGHRAAGMEGTIVIDPPSP
jgi:plastocyanin